VNANELERMAYCERYLGAAVSPEPPPATAGVTDHPDVATSEVSTKRRMDRYRTPFRPFADTKSARC
jgi:hypothetical protein